MESAFFDLPASKAVRFEPANIAWDLMTFPGGQAVYQRLSKDEPAMPSVLRCLHKEVPIAQTCASFAVEPYCRPLEHRRSYYFSFASGATLAFKGTEPLAADFAEEVRHIDSLRCPFCHSALNHFVAREHKVPLGVSVDEALTQAQITARFQVDYLSRYSRLARVPVPLLVVRWSQKYTAALLEALKPFLAKTSFANLRRVTESGLGALVYYYPSLPLRASHAALDKVADLTETGISPERMGVSFAERLDTLRQRFEPSQTIHRWMNLFADMLFLGYFPFDTYYMGHCLQPQNLCIDGGCADTDSLVPMSTIAEERYFIELFLDASIWLAWSISHYLRGSLEENYANAVITCCVWEDLHRLLRDRLARGEACDPRLERIVKSEDLFARLEFLLGNILLGAVSPRKVGDWPTNKF